MRKLFVFLLCLGVLGCATTAKYEARLNTLIGISEEDLVASWGVPRTTYVLDNGKKAVEYVRQGTVQTGGYFYESPQTRYHSGTLDGKTYRGTTTSYETVLEPVQYYRYFCKTSFILNKDRQVESWHHEGNDCVADR